MSPVPSRILSSLLALWSVACVGTSAEPEAAGPSPGAEPDDRPAGPIAQPGAPGESARAFDAGELSALGGVAYTSADVHFMRGMILHHAQALEMTALVPSRAGSEAVLRMALRMEISQRDEIALMERWLRDRGREAPEWRGAMVDGTAHAMTEDGTALMPGMLSPGQMDDLRSADRGEFDRLFLEYMIQHHEGAVVMVQDLFAAPGAGQEAELFRFASHVDADQTAEIARMREVLSALR